MAKIVALENSVREYVLPSTYCLQGCRSSVTLKQSQVSALLAQAVFCALPGPPKGEFLSANFDSLYSANMPAKLKCLKAYFEQRSESKKEKDTNITFERRVLDDR